MSKLAAALAGMETSPVFKGTELRAVPVEGKEGESKLVGYAAVYGVMSQDLGGFKEKIEKGAFDDTLRSGGDVLALVEHNPGLVLGRKSRGTLVLSSDDVGLKVEITPGKTTVGNDALENVRRGDIEGMSFRFPRGAEDSWEMVGGEAVRSLKKVGLKEVSITSMPAYLPTSVGVEGADELRSYAEAKIAELKKPKVDAAAEAEGKRKMDEAGRKLRLLGLQPATREEIRVAEQTKTSDELRCGGSYYDSWGSTTDAARSVLYGARSTFDSAQSAINKIKKDVKNGDAFDDDCAQAMVDAADECGRAIERMQKFVAEVASAVPGERAIKPRSEIRVLK